MPARRNIFARWFTQILAKSNDAIITFDQRRLRWNISTTEMNRRVQIDSGLRLTSFQNLKTNTEWLTSNPTPAFKLILGDQTIDSLTPGWHWVGQTARILPNQAVESIITLGRDALNFEFHQSAFPETSILEQWSVVKNTGTQTLPVLAGLDDLQLDLQPSAGNLVLYWVQGLDPQGGNVGDPPHIANLKLCSRELAEGTTGDVFSTRRSSEENLGWFALHSPALREGIVGAIDWSGGWQLRASCSDGRTLVQAIAEDFRRELAPGDEFETPHRFIGFFQGDLDDAANVTRTFARRFLMRPSSSDFPYAHFNTWFAHYINLDEDTLKREVDHAARMGLEAFCIDAGWYAGSPTDADFSFGLGTWRENRDKFPGGLAAFADYVHIRGMKFGLWVEPERADLKYAGPGTEIPLEWFSPRTPFDAVPPPDLPQSARIWLGHPDARAWTKDWLTRVIRDYHVDWLKWDNNLWLSCDPPGEIRDTEYAHVRGLYEILDYLHEQFPQLVIENCASGGHRMDFGLLRRTDVQWLADDTEPGFRVRYYLAGAGYVFPPEYLNTWLVESYFEHMGAVSEPGILRVWLRSRMMGAFGISRSLADLNELQLTIIAEEIARYKTIRPILKNAMVYRLLPQSDLLAPPFLQPPAEPDAVEFYDPAAKNGVVFFFQGAAWDNRMLLLKGLPAETLYQIESSDRSISEQRTGQQLMTEGIAISRDDNNPSALVFFRAV